MDDRLKRGGIGQPCGNTKVARYGDEGVAYIEDDMQGGGWASDLARRRYCKMEDVAHDGKARGRQGDSGQTSHRQACTKTLTKERMCVREKLKKELDEVVVLSLVLG